MKTKCPHCGKTLHPSAFKCTRCKRWIPNDLFDRLTEDDAALIRDRDLTPYTPSLMALMVNALLEDGVKKNRKQWQKTLGRKLTGKEEFTLLLFRSFCYFAAIRLAAGKKEGREGPIIQQLRDALLNRVIESSGVRLSGMEYEESTRRLVAAGDELYAKLDGIWNAPGTDAPSQLRKADALASVVFGDPQATMLHGLALYNYLMGMVWHVRTTLANMFLVEEDDFDWQSAVPKGWIPGK